MNHDHNNFFAPSSNYHLAAHIQIDSCKTFLLLQVLYVGENSASRKIKKALLSRDRTCSFHDIHKFLYVCVFYSDIFIKGSL